MALPENPTSQALLIGSKKGSELADALDHVIHQTARSEPLPGTDPEACRAVMDLCVLIDAGERIDPKEATKAARLLLGCYRAKDFVDVDTFAMALVATLSDYPAPVVRMIVDPKRGMPRKYKFPPTIAEVADELDALDKRLHWAWRGACRVLGYERTR